MQTRPLGKTGERLSVIGCGALVFVNEGPEFANDTVARAIDAGINYFDMGPSYGGGGRPKRGADPLLSLIATISFSLKKLACAQRLRR